MEFNNKPTQWDAKGVEPTTELKEKGFTAGYKPPADYFNYLFNKITACIKELQSGLSNVDNTADADKSVKHATTATEANSATKATQDANGNVITDTYAKKTETNAIKTTVGDSNVEYTTQKVFGDNFMPIIEIHKGGNLINAVKDLSAQVADMFSSLKTYFATKKENDETVVSNTVTGKNVTATDSADAPIISQKVKGYTKQDGTPTPDAPVDIVGMDNVSVKTCGKNLLNKEAMQSVSHYGVDYTLNEDGSVYVKGTCTTSSYMSYGYFDGKAGQKYVLNGCPSGGGASTYKIGVYVGGYGISYLSSDFGNGVTITCDEDTRYYVSIVVYNGTQVDYTYKPMVRAIENEYATYEPYTETVAEIILATISSLEPLYEGDYVEYRADGTGVLHRKMASVVFDGSSDELWGVSLSTSTNTYYAYLNRSVSTLGIKKSCTNIYSTHYKATGRIEGVANNIYSKDDGTLIVREERFATVDEYKAWLQSNPVTVVYELAEPQEIELTAEQLAQFKQLRTFEPVTNIFCDGETITQYYKANDNGGAVGGLQDRVTEIEGAYADKAIYGDDSISLGRKADTSSPSGSVALGENVTASNYNSHAEGCYTTASGENAHAEGNSTKASNFNSHAEGYWTTALENQHAQGHYNNTSLATSNSTSGTSSGTAFVIGNGTSNAASNAFRVTGEGKAIGKTSFATTGADYAEYFEWADGNPDNEDRVGYFVTFADGNLIKKATEGDYILGIVSGMPCVIGNNDECWMKQFEMDEWGRFIYETHTEIDEETGEEKEYTFYKVNPDYDPKKPYVHREKRQEWSAIGMMGVLSVYDDGTCQVNGYCKCTKNGIATAAEKGEESYRVIARVTDNIVKVVFK